MAYEASTFGVHAEHAHNRCVEAARRRRTDGRNSVEPPGIYGFRMEGANVSDRGVVGERTRLPPPPAWWLAPIAVAGVTGVVILDGDARASLVIGSASLLAAVGLVAVLVGRRTWPPSTESASELDRWVLAALATVLMVRRFGHAGRIGIENDQLTELFFWVLSVVLAVGATVALLLRRPPPVERRGWATTIGLVASVACIVCGTIHLSSVPYRLRLAISRSEMETTAPRIWKVVEGARGREPSSTVQIDRLGDFEITGVDNIVCTWDRYTLGIGFATGPGSSFAWCPVGEPEHSGGSISSLGGGWWDVRDVGL